MLVWRAWRRRRAATALASGHICKHKNGNAMEKFTLTSCLLAGGQSKLMPYFRAGSVFEEDLLMCSDKVRESYKSENSALLQHISKQTIQLVCQIAGWFVRTRILQKRQHGLNRNWNCPLHTIKAVNLLHKVQSQLITEIDLNTIFKASNSKDFVFRPVCFTLVHLFPFTAINLQHCQVLFQAIVWYKKQNFKGYGRLFSK